MSKSKSKDYLRKKSVNYKHSSRKRQRNRADVQFAPLHCSCRACRRSKKSVAGDFNTQRAMKGQAQSTPSRFRGFMK